MWLRTSGAGSPEVSVSSRWTATDSREVVDPLAVDAEAVDELLALPDPERGQSDLVAVSHVGGSLVRARLWQVAPSCAARTDRLWKPRRLLRSVPRKMAISTPCSRHRVAGAVRPGRGRRASPSYAARYDFLRLADDLVLRQARRGSLWRAAGVPSNARSALRHSRSAAMASFWRHVPGEDRSLQGGVAVDLRHADRDVRALARVVVLPVVHEGLPEGRRAVETGDAESANSSIESIRVIPSRCSSVPGCEDRRDLRQAVEDVVGLQRHHAAERDALVAHLLECADAVGVARRDSIPGRRRLVRTRLRRSLAQRDELLGESQGESAGVRPSSGRPSSQWRSGS